MMMAEPKMNYNEETVRRVQAQLQDNNSMRALSAFFKVIGDETRVKIICALSVQELCVNELAGVLGMTQSAVSHQLKLLKVEDQVKSRREGKNIYYSLDDEHVVDIITAALEHIKHTKL